ncbi:MAG: peptidoglycan-binding protein [Oscillospiraceae bacterium]|nr:peptidoglycan-binding protein [Oscillospiraceae bacterium]
MAVISNADRQAVYDLQNMLYVISRYENGTPDIIPDGIDGQKTTDAVIKFQQRNNLTPNGIYDLATWNAISNRYREVQALLVPAVRLGFFPRDNDAVFVRGDSHNAVYAVQLLFKMLADDFAEYQNGGVLGILDELTENNLVTFQNAHSLEPHGRLDKNTWNKLANYHNLYHL